LNKGYYYYYYYYHLDGLYPTVAKLDNISIPLDSLTHVAPFGVIGIAIAKRIARDN
jgi:hypothetical protein